MSNETKATRTEAALDAANADAQAARDDLAAAGRRTAAMRDDVQAKRTACEETKRALAQGGKAAEKAYSEASGKLALAEAALESCISAESEAKARANAAEKRAALVRRADAERQAMAIIDAEWVPALLELRGWPAREQALQQQCIGALQRVQALAPMTPDSLDRIVLERAGLPPPDPHAWGGPLVATALRMADGEARALEERRRAQKTADAAQVARVAEDGIDRQILDEWRLALRARRVSLHDTAELTTAEMNYDGAAFTAWDVARAARVDAPHLDPQKTSRPSLSCEDLVAIQRGMRIALLRLEKMEEFRQQNAARNAGAS